MEGACYLFVFCYLVCIQSITNTNGLRLPFSSITSKSTPVKPKSSLNCSSSITTGSSSSGTSNITPEPLNSSSISSATCQQNLPAVNLNPLPNKAYSPSLFSTQNYLQVLPKVNLDSTALPTQCFNNIDSPNTFKVQNLLSSSLPTLPGVNLYSFGQSANPNIKNYACEKNPVLSNAISSFNPRPAITSNSNAFDTTSIAESPMTSIYNGNNNIGYPNTFKIQSTMSSNRYQELPEVNLNRNPSISSNALATALSVSNNPSNQACNFMTNEGLVSNPFSTPSKSTLSTAPCSEGNIPLRTISLQNLDQNFNIVPNGLFPASTFTVASGKCNLSSSQNKLNSLPSYLEPQLRFNSASLPTCNIVPSSDPVLNNLYYNFNVSPILQMNPGPVSSLSHANFNLETLCLEPKLSNSVSSYNNFLPNNPFSINAVSNSDFNTIMSPSYLASPTLTSAKEIKTQTCEDNQIKLSKGFNSFDSFSPKSIIFIDPTQNSANAKPFLSSSVNSLPGVSIGCNTINQCTDTLGSFVSQNVQIESPSSKKTSVSNNQNVFNTFQTNILNGFDTIPASDLPLSLQTLKNSCTVPSTQNGKSPQLTNPPKWNNFCPNDCIGPTSQIDSSNPFASKTGSFTSEFNTLPDVTLSNLKVSNYPQSFSFSNLNQTPTPFNLPQNCRVNSSGDSRFGNLPISQLSFIPGLSVPTLYSNGLPLFSLANDISSSNFLYPSQACESNFPQINTNSQTMFSPLGVTSSDLERKVLSNCDSAKDNNIFTRHSVASNAVSFINPQSTISKIVPNNIIPQSIFGDLYQPNFFSNMNSMNCPSVNLPTCLNPVTSFSDFRVQNPISSSNSFEPQTQNRISPNNCLDDIFYLSSPTTNCPSGINNNVVKLPNCGAFDFSSHSIPSNDFNLGPIINLHTNDFNYESVVSIPNYATFNSDPFSLNNKAVNYIPLTSLPEVSCFNDTSIYQTANNCNGLSPGKNFDVPNFSVLTSLSASPINYINTCSESVSPISEFTSSLTQSILDGVFSGDLTFKPKSEIPMTLPPVNPYSNQINSIPSFNNIRNPSIFQESSSKFEYPQSVPLGSNSLPSDVLGFDSYSNYYYPLTSDKVWSDSYDFTSRIPLNSLPSVNPYCNGNFQPSVPSISSTPSFSSSSFYPTSSLYPSDLELLFDTYPDSLSSLPSDLSWMDYVDSYDYYEPELFTDSYRQSYPGNCMSRPDYAGLIPFGSDLTYSSPSFLPSTNLMPSFEYAAPVIKVKDLQESKELARLLEYIVLLELVDNNYNCDWDLLERLIAMLYAFD